MNFAGSLNIPVLKWVFSLLNIKLGAKKAGITKVLIPEENLQDLEILRKENISPEDDNFKVICVSHFNQVLKETIID